eukprot:gnl/TRDRNA2_/TRDRNA2_76570_c1_seq1.p1 gnl/TRDRNA2_/TRDRNA2_76570_c1~~gnl/TRDRNA2_/TRDRNA2_76570_c1_seq1.p1  ORF type:complete len:478 (+),score=74.59 gnl/TRDRNA2_/TRDRNA2_76570_c1_seq1:91-1434(+)
MLALARAVADGGGGIFQFVGDFSTFDDVAFDKRLPAQVETHRSAEMDWMKAIAQEHGQKVSLSWTVGHGRDDPVGTEASIKMHFGLLEDIKKAGGVAIGGTFVRPQGALWSFGASLHPFIVSRTYRQLQAKTEGNQEALLDQLRMSETKNRILAEVQAAFASQNLKTKPQLKELYTALQPWGLVYRWTPHYEPTREDSIEAIAAKEGREPLPVIYDLLLNEKVLWKPMFSWSTRDHEPMHRMLSHPQIVPGADDAGAHGSVITEASSPSHLLTHWVRDRVRGPRMTIEHAIQKQTQGVAEMYKLDDRGVLAPGKKADLNVIDLEKLKILKPNFVHDLPMSTGRWVQQVEGYRLTLVSGVETFQHGKPTGALPGRLVRNPCRDAAAWKGISWQMSGSFEKATTVTEEYDNREHALLGAGSGGASATARVLRENDELGSTAGIASKSRL